MVDKKPVIKDERCVLCAACLEACKFEAMIGDIPTREVPEFPDHKGVMVFAEQTRGIFHKSVYELLGCARGLADELGESVIAVAIGSGLQEAARELIHYGADMLAIVEDPTLEHYRTCSYTYALSEIVLRRKPSILLIPATHLGRDLAPRLARRLELGLTADCTRLSIDPDQKILMQTRPAFGGNIMATIVSRYSRPQTCTVRPGIMSASPPDRTRQGEITMEEIPMDGCEEFSNVLECIMSPPGGPDLDNAKIIVAGGRPTCSDKGMAVLKEFADSIGAQLACTRIVVEEGQLPAERQVGQTGKTVKPEVYFACGISGAIQHRAGMDGSRYIVAINSDPDAPIFEIADFAIVGDLFQILPEMTKALKG
jgi:electron transfer flavoprotein alpha subunit